MTTGAPGAPSVQLAFRIPPAEVEIVADQLAEHNVIEIYAEI
jgi:hypothetical protein